MVTRHPSTLPAGLCPHGLGHRAARRPRPPASWVTCGRNALLLILFFAGLYQTDSLFLAPGKSWFSSPCVASASGLLEGGYWASGQRVGRFGLPCVDSPPLLCSGSAHTPAPSISRPAAGMWAAVARPPRSLGGKHLGQRDGPCLREFSFRGERMATSFSLQGHGSNYETPTSRGRQDAGLATSCFGKMKAVGVSTFSVLLLL